jgi:large-conductance mechanosensitive channel
MTPLETEILSGSATVDGYGPTLTEFIVFMAVLATLVFVFVKVEEWRAKRKNKFRNKEGKMSSGEGQNARS